MGAAIVVVLAMFVGTAGLWPWDHDEVATLGELGVVAPTQYPEPIAQLERMPSLVPVWHLLQNAVLAVLPFNEWTARLLPATSGALAVVIAFIVARRREGRWFAWSLLVLAAGSQTLIWLSQQNRFYPLAILWTTLSIVAVWSEDEGWRSDLLAVLFALLAVLSHNIALVLFCLGAAAAMVCALLGRMPPLAARRAVLSGAVVAALYLAYLRPLISGWASGNTGGTQPLVSMVAQVGIVPLALALFGSVVAVGQERRWTAAAWWTVLFVFACAFVAASPWIVGNWNPRYAVFFMIPVWVMAAFGSATVAERLASGPARMAWLLVVALMLAPKLASHFVDGSRHDLRAAAALVAAEAPHATVLSNWPAELQYYLQPLSGQRAAFWYPGERLPDGDAVLVVASNAWEPVVSSPTRSMRVLAEIRRRRFDEQSHVVRVYRLAPVASKPEPGVPGANEQ
jgi:hypothetical protein